jgi:hypothetical protein
MKKIFFDIAKYPLIIFFSYFAYKFLFKSKDKLPLSDSKDSDLKETDTSDLSEHSSLNNLQANSLAERLYDAMDTLGTDFKSIQTIIKSLNKYDLASVHKAYGVRTLHLFGVPYKEGDLISHLISELSSSDFKQIEPSLKAAKLI